MKSRLLIPALLRWCGIASALGGLLIILARVPQFTYFRDAPLAEMAKRPGFVYLLGLPSLAASILSLLGIVGLYVVQARKAGLFGAGAFLLAFTGLCLSTGANWAYAFVAPVLAQVAPAALADGPTGRALTRALLACYLLGQVGMLLFGVSVWWARVFPKWLGMVVSGTILAVGILTSLATTQFFRFVYNALIGVGPIAIGYCLYKAPITVSGIE